MKERLPQTGETILPYISPAQERLLRNGLRVFLGRITKEVKTSGLENVPRGGPYLVAANHLGWAEGPILLATFPDWIYFMTKIETFDLPVIGSTCRKLGMFPVRRGEMDLRAIRTAIGLLKNGRVLGIMPEGTRGRKGESEALKEAKRGAMLIAHLSQAPIVPVAVWGPEKIFPLIEEQGLKPRDLVHFQRPTVYVNIGPVFKKHLEINPKLIRKEKMEELSTDLMLEIRRLLPPKYHGVYSEI